MIRHKAVYVDWGSMGPMKNLNEKCIGFPSRPRVIDAKRQRLVWEHLRGWCSFTDFVFMGGRVLPVKSKMSGKGCRIGWLEGIEEAEARLGRAGLPWFLFYYLFFNSARISFGSKIPLSMTSL
jgi:hypothetical protein